MLEGVETPIEGSESQSGRDIDPVLLLDPQMTAVGVSLLLP